MELKAGLYIVPTPIGNLSDITLRALEVLKNAEIIACEDTRRTGILLKHYQIANKRLISYYDQVETSKAAYIAEFILAGKLVALVSDSGTPGISDPGFRIIKHCIENDLPIYPLPGPTAFVPALIASGLAIHQFSFFGFPPIKKGRKTFIKNISNCPNTVIVYESPNKLMRLLNELKECSPRERKVCIARELSKVYEEFIRGSIEECINILSKKASLKGEFVIVIESHKPETF